ncbi:L,D-transpeptidase [Mesorhizobium sp. BAC0120]|uniref:L,D-transpeptidase n=1 Tax=Mesorhizobium sp. BAC0120 TaxID=3090670 RepID=UPI00298BD7E7|nr:L,D-transpeptidase [Mesorhizobium sp. BAC0120]MDW6025049.1 L,D-transpeptidase [Mesorhizobium sp. BAC0120]
MIFSLRRRSVAPGRDDRPVAGRGAISSVCAVIVAIAIGATAFAAGTQIFDPKTRKWVDYDKTKAWKYYSVHKQVPEAFRPQIVQFRTAEVPGTIIIDGNQHFLYLVMPGKQAMRYGIGVGRDGFGWAGIVRIGRMAEWPTWTPPAEMVARDPKAVPFAAGMEGGPNNPLGARALYLYEGDNDTIYRIHGTPEPWTIGLDVSSGCIRMNNDDIMDLYDRVKVGAKVIVLMQGAALYKGV